LTNSLSPPPPPPADVTFAEEFDVRANIEEDPLEPPVDGLPLPPAPTVIA
jgi:hypothetical protein